MKLEIVANYITEVDDEDQKRPPPVAGSGTISTSQAARILGVVVSRVRQFIRDKVLKSTKPRKGDRDHELLKKDVDDLRVKRGKKSGKGTDKEGDKEREKEEKEKSSKKEEGLEHLEGIVVEYLIETLIEEDQNLNADTVIYYTDMVMEQLADVITEEDYDLDVLRTIS